jgi:hypothetical protein
MNDEFQMTNGIDFVPGSLPFVIRYFYNVSL